MKDIMEKLKGVLVESDLSEIKQSINEMVELKVEEHKKKVEKAAESFVAEKVAATLQEKEKAITEEYDCKLKKFEEDVLEKLDMFIESEVVGNISEELMEDVARVSMYKPIVEGIERLFAENYVALDTEGDVVMAKKDREVTQLREMADKQMDEIKELKTLAEKAAIKLLFVEKTTGLTKSQKARAWDLIEGWDFDKVQQKLKTVLSLVTENEDEYSNDDNIGDVNPDDYTDETEGLGDEAEGAGDEGEGAGDESEGLEDEAEGLEDQETTDTKTESWSSYWKKRGSGLMFG